MQNSNESFTENIKSDNKLKKDILKITKLESNKEKISSFH